MVFRKHVPNQLAGVLHQRTGALPEFSFGKRILSPVPIVAHVNIRLTLIGEVALQRFRIYHQRIHLLLVIGKVLAILLGELLCCPLANGDVPVLAAQLMIAHGGDDLNGILGNLRHGNVERTAAQIVNQNLLVVRFVQTVGNCCGGRLIDHVQHVDSGTLCCLTGVGTLVVGEVCRHSDNCAVHFLVHLLLYPLDQFFQENRGQVHCGIGAPVF